MILHSQKEADEAIEELNNLLPYIDDHSEVNEKTRRVDELAELIWDWECIYENFLFDKETVIENQNQYEIAKEALNNEELDLDHIESILKAIKEYESQ